MGTHSSIITVRPECPEDERFLFELYASTRGEELDAWGWPPDMRSNFLSLQFKASQAQHGAYPDADFQIVLLDGNQAGRIIIDRRPDALHLVDIALLPQHRGAGIGSALMQRFFAESAGTRKPIRLNVLNTNSAICFYEKLGFVRTGQNELHTEMEWRAPEPAPKPRPVAGHQGASGPRVGV